MAKPAKKSMKQQKAVAAPSIPRKRARKAKMASGMSGNMVEVAEYVPFRAKPSTITRSGKDSAIISFCQPLTTIAEAASSDAVFTNGTLADTAYSNGIIIFGPSTLNGPLLNNCQPWTEYRFRSVKIKYHPACPSTTSGAFAIGVSFAQQSQAATDFSSFAAIQQANVGYSGPYWQGFELNVALEDPSWKRVDYSVSGTVQDVLGAPFSLGGRGSQAASAAATRGYLTIHGSLEVRSAVPLQGVTMQVRSKHDLNLLREVYKMLCPAPEPLPPIATTERDVIDEVVARMTDLFGKVKPSGASTSSSVRSWA